MNFKAYALKHDPTVPPWLLFATGYSRRFLVWHSRPLRVASSTPAPSSPAASDTAPVLLQHQASCHAPCWPPGLGTVQNPLGLHTSTDAEHSPFLSAPGKLSALARQFTCSLSVLPYFPVFTSFSALFPRGTNFLGSRDCAIHLGVLSP